MSSNTKSLAPKVTLDGSQLSILNTRFEGVSKKMSNTLLRTGRSGVLNRARDFSCCVVTHNNELLNAVESLPIHVLSGPDLMAKTMIAYHPTLKKGDAFLHNSPYHGCSHAADHSILMPVIDDKGLHHFTVVAKAHQADIGNSIPTTYFGDAKDVYQEGALIFPATKVLENYHPIEDIVRMCKMRIRVPDQWHGDFMAMIGAARIGEQEILKLAEEFGWDTLHAFEEQWFNYSETLMDAALKQLPEGYFTATSTHDAMEGTLGNEVKIQAEVSIDPSEGTVSVDLSDNPDCLPCGLNVSEACVRTSAMIGIFNSIDHQVPKNAGSFRRIQLTLRENCIVGIPNHPTSCSAATTNVSDRIANAVQIAISEIAEGYGMAEIGSNLPPSRGVFSGIDPRTFGAFINQVFLGSSGGGASPNADGWFHYSHAGNGGMGFIDSVELAELYQPIIVNHREIVRDSEGAGRYRGAPSKRIEFTAIKGAQVDVAFVTDGIDNPPQGAAYGESSQGASQYLVDKQGVISTLGNSEVTNLTSEYTLVSVTCGGGGYGKATSREPKRVLLDVIEGVVSLQKAKDTYAVHISEQLKLDEIATEQLRRSYR
ncbi:hydantoinase B/oxoprolinase family protein [Paraglaciecola arctica]|uniref:hydantoinase B/oxoprolinase family protein n=1 Tax=Paraglaciecola arctica TaxID=1128911 RepID=UPI001C0778EA|nr:hydantoinase B/oxoprolinase family protein [Paraglaciecola arctica]MBU3004257.1 hydantoinase B/oxoprolinase family protein [Paraglaciecola arctica]